VLLIPNMWFWMTPYHPVNVTQRMRIANFPIKMTHSHCFQPLLSNGSRQKHKI